MMVFTIKLLIGMAIRTLVNLMELIFIGTKTPPPGMGVVNGDWITGNKVEPVIIKTEEVAHAAHGTHAMIIIGLALPNSHLDQMN